MTIPREKTGFRDTRLVKALQSAIGTIPAKSLQFPKSNPASKKITGLLGAAKKKGGGLFGKFAKFGMKFAAKAAMGPVGYAAFKAIDGKFNVTGRLAGAIRGKLPGAGMKLSSLAGKTSLGVKITEEQNPEKIRRPLKNGIAVGATLAAKPLSQTVAASMAQSLISGIPLGSALPPVPRKFKTAASLVKSPRFWNPAKVAYNLTSKDVAAAENAVQHIPASTPTNVLYAQRGLLQDEIMYRLTLLAENVYAPTNARAVSQGYPPLTILEGFRAEHTGSSQHELGEAMDITLGDGALNNAPNCYALAQWMRDAILYDQLILCFSELHGGQVWIHVSFNPESRRRQVLTKAFNDTHQDGLHLYGAYTDATVRATDTGLQTDVLDQADKFTNVLTARQDLLEPVSIATVNLVQSPNNPIITAMRSISTDCTTQSFVDNIPCGSGCRTTPHGVPSLEQITEYATVFKNKLQDAGLSFDGDNRHHMYGLVTIAVARTLWWEDWATTGLLASPAGVQFNANNPYFKGFKGYVGYSGETTVLPNGVYFDPYTILLSKHGPEIRIGDASGINVSVDDDVCKLNQWASGWLHPVDGTNTTYASTAPSATLVTNPPNCISQFNVAPTTIDSRCIGGSSGESGGGSGGSGGGFVGGGGVTTPVIGANDQLNLKQVTFLHTNVSEWPITSNITDVRITGKEVCVSHTKAGQFPQSQFGDIMVEGNVWIFARINGQWFGATWDWLRVGQTCKSVTASEFGADQIRIAPMDSSWVPRLGEEVGFMMSTRARDGVSAGQERTNVVLVTWPY